MSISYQIIENLKKYFDVKYILSLMMFLTSVPAIAQIETDLQDKKVQKITSLIDSGEFIEALKVINASEIDSVADFSLLYYKGICYLNISKYRQDAPDYLKHLVAIAYENDLNIRIRQMTRFFYAQSLYVTYQFDEAIAELESLKSIIPRSERTFREDIQAILNYAETGLSLVQNPRNVSISNLENINSEFNDHSPIVNVDESVLIFTSQRPGSIGGKITEDGQFYEDIYISERQGDAWGEPHRIPDMVNTGQHESAVGLSLDGQTVYIYRESKGSGDLYSTILQDNGLWSEPIPLDFVNTRYRETHISQSADGNTLFFTSDRKGGYGGMDIYIINKLPDGTWGKALNLGPVINTSEDEESPFMHPDGTLYFSSRGHQSMGGFDIFSSESDENYNFRSPKNIGFPINSIGDDVFYTPNVDGRHAYFSSEREDSKGRKDIYMIDFSEPVHDGVAVAVGYALNPDNTAHGVSIAVKHPLTARLYAMCRPNPQTGKFVCVLQLNKRYRFEYQFKDGGYILKNIKTPNLRKIPDDKIIFLDTVSQSGRISNTVSLISNRIVKQIDLHDIDAISETDFSEKEIDDIVWESENSAITEGLTQSEKSDVENSISNADTLQNQILTDRAQQEFHPQDFLDEKMSASALYIDNMLFDLNSTAINKYTEQLQELADYLINCPQTRVRISGHADSSGDSLVNNQLAKQRAWVVARFLQKLGVDSAQLILDAHGAAQPIALCTKDGKTDRTGAAYNRRVDFSVVETHCPNKRLIIRPILVPTRYRLNQQVLVYTIFLISSDKEIEIVQPFKNEVFKYNNTTGVVSYFYGHFTDRDKAVQMLKLAREKGYFDALIVEWQPRLEMQNMLSYSINIVSSPKKLPISTFSKIGHVEEWNRDNRFNYVYGLYFSLTEAESQRSRIVKLGYPNAFIFINDTL